MNLSPQEIQMIRRFRALSPSMARMVDGLICDCQEAEPAALCLVHPPTL